MGNIFVPLMRGKLVIVGIGNPLRADDGFGPALIARLQGHSSQVNQVNQVGQVGLVCIDAGISPENYVGRIAREAPDTILLVDVAHLDLAPGQYRILQPADISKSGLTTHDMSSRVLIEFLADQSHANVYMLGVQPQTVALGEAMSDCVLKTLDKVESLILEAASCTRPI